MSRKYIDINTRDRGFLEGVNRNQVLDSYGWYCESRNKAIPSGEEVNDCQCPDCGDDCIDMESHLWSPEEKMKSMFPDGVDDGFSLD